MTALSDHLKNIGNGPTNSFGVSSTTPPKTEVYMDQNGFVRIPNSGIVIKGQPEALVGMTIIVEPDRGKTG